MFTPDILLPSQLPSAGAETPYQRLAVAILHDLVRHATKAAITVAKGKPVHPRVEEQIRKDWLWVNTDNAPFPFATCIALITPPEQRDHDSVGTWRRLLNDILRGRVIMTKLRRISPRAGSQSPKPVPFRERD